MTKRKRGPCAVCHPPIEPELGRQGLSGIDRPDGAARPIATGAAPEHIAARFEDGANAAAAGMRYVVELDGDDVTDNCTEAMAGQPGWVIVAATVKAKGRGPGGLGPHEGLCYRGALPAHVRGVYRKGHVTIRLVPR